MNEFTFTSLPISQEILRALSDMGFEEATPIQAETIPHILESRDLLGQAQTGTGKTCAFGIPVIDSVDPESNHIQTLILSPTRELAIQIAEELHNVAKYKEGVRIVAVYGGQPIDRQIMALKRKPQIIVGTPGRVMDHMRRKTLRLEHLEKIVLDEADEMLNMGFKEDIDTILESTPETVQKIFFSATMPRAIVELTKRYLKDPIHVKIASKEMTIPLVEQYFIEVRESNKVEIMSRLIDAGNVSRALVFCNTKRRVDELADKLNTRGYSVEALHGDMKQASRDRVMKQFRSGKLDLLVATDVAARGIDVDDIEVVFNYDLPSDDEYYVHRVGRTARAGKSGKAYTFVVGREIIDLKNIQHAIKANITRASIPTLMNVQESRITGVLEGTGMVLSKGELADYINYIDQYTEGLNVSNDDDHFYTTTDVAAALLKQLCGESLTQRDDVEEVVPYEDYAKRARNREMNGGAPEMNTRNHGRAVESGMQRLFLNVGIKDRIRPNQIVQFVASQADIPGKVIGAIAIFDEFTFVDVPTDMAEMVVEKTNMQRIGRTSVHVELKKDSQGDTGTAPARRPFSDGPRPERKSFGDGPRPERKSFGDGPRPERKNFSDGPRPERKNFSDGPRPERKSYGDGPRPERKSYGDGPRPERTFFSDTPHAEKKSYRPKPRAEKKPFGDAPHAEKKTYSDAPRAEKKYPPKAHTDQPDKPKERKKRSDNA
jgi:ATP-dependent RNA helicase DeaD